MTRHAARGTWHALLRSRTAARGTRIAAFLVTTALLGSCRSASSTEMHTIHFWAFGREGEVVSQLVPEFEKRNPGIRVDVQQIPWTAAHEKLLTAFAGNATPDIALLGNTWVPEFEAIGALEPLDPWVNRSPVVDRRDYFDGIWDTNVVDDTLFGVPWYVDTRVLFYRGDLLARAGYTSMPGHWSEWRTALERIKAQGGPQRWAILLPTSEWAPPVALAVANGAAILRDGGRYGDFRGPQFRQAYDFYIGLFRAGLAPAISADQVPNLFQEFARGTFAMYITGPWNVGEFKRRLPAGMQDAWGTAPLPAPDDSTAPGASLAGGSSLVLFHASSQKADAWKLVEFLSDPLIQRRFLELTGDLPARRSAWTDSLRNDRYMRAFWAQLQHVRATPKVPEWESIANRLQDYDELVVRGRMQPDAALASLDHDVDQMLEKRRWMLARRAAVAAQTAGTRR